MKAYTEVIFSPIYRTRTLPTGSMKGENMHDTEVNKRAREIEKELQIMKEQWVKMYDLLTKLIDDTETEKE